MSRDAVLAATRCIDAISQPFLGEDALKYGPRFLNVAIDLCREAGIQIDVDGLQPGNRLGLSIAERNSAASILAYYVVSADPAAADSGSAFDAAAITWQIEVNAALKAASAG